MTLLPSKPCNSVEDTFIRENVGYVRGKHSYGEWILALPKSCILRKSRLSGKDESSIAKRWVERYPEDRRVRGLRLKDDVVDDYIKLTESSEK